MRIRKGLLLSSMLSQTASDPQLVQPTTSLELHPIRPKTQPQPSDPSNQPPSSLPSHHPSKILGNTGHNFEIKQKVRLEEASRDEQGGNGAGTRKQNIILAAQPLSETVLTPLSSRQVDERWFDVDKKIPMNKRKGLHVEKTSQETLMLDKAKKIKSRTSKKCSAGAQQHDDSNSTKHNMNNIVKKSNKLRGGAIMEGSRCSRVNGRGWRCCQQTLVGYSLCEHHLGKGRLRSITNVKGRAKMPTAVAASTSAPHNDSTADNTTNHNQPAKKVLQVSSSVVQPARDYNKATILLDGTCRDHNDEDKEEDEDDDDDYNDEEMKKPLVVKKKRMKLGMVKARSLSSLLNQTNNALVVAADDN